MQKTLSLRFNLLIEKKIMKKINLLKSNIEEISAVLTGVNGRSIEHTFAAADVFRLAKKLDSELSRLKIPKTKRTGALLHCRSGEKLPSAYKYERAVTFITLEWRPSGIFLTALSKACAYREGGWSELTLTEDQERIALKAVTTWHVVK